MRIKAFRSGLARMSVLCLVLAAPLWAQVSSTTPGRDPLAGLKNALQAAGANPLTSDQQQQLQTMITAYRNALKGGTPDATLQSDRGALEAAILAKDSDAVKAASDKIAADLASRTSSNLQNLANFEIQVLGVLTSDQISALQNHIGTAGLVRQLQSLAGGFNRAGRFGPWRSR